MSLGTILLIILILLLIGGLPVFPHSRNGATDPRGSSAHCWWCCWSCCCWA